MFFKEYGLTTFVLKLLTFAVVTPDISRGTTVHFLHFIDCIVVFGDNSNLSCIHMGFQQLHMTN